MIISDKQIMQLMQFSQSYVTALDTLYQFDKTLLSNCGLHNKIVVAELLMQIANQQSDELRDHKSNEVFSENKECPLCGKFRVSEGVCWEIGCRYRE